MNRKFDQILLRERERFIVTEVVKKVMNFSIEHKFWTVMNKNFYTSFKEEFWAKAVNKFCKQKLWAKAVNRACEQVLWTKDVNKSCEQKMWIKVVSKNCEQNFIQKFWTKVLN